MSDRHTVCGRKIFSTRSIVSRHRDWYIFIAYRWHRILLHSFIFVFEKGFGDFFWVLFKLFCGRRKSFREKGGGAGAERDTALRVAWKGVVGLVGGD